MPNKARLLRFTGHCLLLLPSLLWIRAVWQYEGMYSFCNLALAAVFHECGHLLAFSSLGLPSPKICPVARGVRLVSPTPLSYRQELTVAAAGPLANLACYAAGLIWHGRFPALAAFGEVSMMTALCNLIPMAELDGERILRCLLAPCLSDRALYLVTRAVSFLALFLGLFFSLVLLWYTGSGTYPAMLCLIALLCRRQPWEEK